MEIKVYGQVFLSLAYGVFMFWVSNYYKKQAENWDSIHRFAKIISPKIIGVLSILVGIYIFIGNFL